MQPTIKERPILFSSPMILALLDGRKTQTRRIIKPQPIKSESALYPDCLVWHPNKTSAHYFDPEDSKSINSAFNPRVYCPYSCGSEAGLQAHRLYVRETWKEALSETHQCYAYKADLSYRCGKKAPPDFEQLTALNGGWKPSIHQPKKASRLWLEITDIRVERLQDISEEDAMSTTGCAYAEGIQKLDNYRAHNQYTIKCELASYNAPTAKEVFAMLWYSIYSVESWETNPWMWAISFKKVEA